MCLVVSKAGFAERLHLTEGSVPSIYDTDDLPASTSSGTRRKSRKCSVIGCHSSLRDASRFKLPEDPEMRLEWVQFVFKVNGQRLRESCWTDITVCSEHFTEDCYAELSPETGRIQLTSSAVPSLGIKPKPKPKPKPKEPPEKPREVEPLKAAGSNSPTVCSEKPKKAQESSKPALTSTEGSPALNGVSTSHSPDVCNAVASGSERIDVQKEKAPLPQMKGKFVVNESCLFQLFPRKCPSCGCKLQMEKVTYGELVAFNQRCLQCDYKSQWKSQVKATIPSADTEVTPEAQQKAPEDENPSASLRSEIVAFSDDDSDPSDEGEDGAASKPSSDGEWSPDGGLIKESEEESQGEDAGDLGVRELCSECGRFFNVLKPHTCEHKTKLFSCSTCGKGAVSEACLMRHRRIYHETHEHRCEFCHATFKIKAHKLMHERLHRRAKDPYRCPKCPKTFATSKKRNTHVTKHNFKCGVCGMEFVRTNQLKRHSLIHTGAKPYECSVCRRGFNQPSHLKSHMRLHTGEKPYRCERCGRGFNHNVSLKSHAQRCHLDNAERKEKKPGDGEAEDSEANGVEAGRDAEEEVQKEATDKPKRKRRSTGRPKGRPKAAKARKTVSSDTEGEDDWEGSDTSFGSAGEEEEEEEEEEKETTRKSRKRTKNNSDSDFVPRRKQRRRGTAVGWARGNVGGDRGTIWNAEKVLKRTEPGD